LRPSISAVPVKPVATIQPRPVTLAQAEKILSAQGFDRTVLVVRDRFDKIKEIIVRE
jgi:hypothetical protein